MGRVLDGGGRKLGGGTRLLWPPVCPGGPLEKTGLTGEVSLTTVSQKYTPCSLTQSVVTGNILPLLVGAFWVEGSGTFTLTDASALPQEGITRAKEKNFAPGVRHTHTHVALRPSGSPGTGRRGLRWGSMCAYQLGLQVCGLPHKEITPG